MGRPRKSDNSEATRSILLRAAEKEFGSRGYQPSRLEDIAAAAGIRRSSLLYHFGSKEELYRQVVAAISTDLRAVVTAAMEDDGDPGQRLEAVADGLLGFARERRAAVAMFVRELLDRPPIGTRHLLELVELVDTLEQFLREQAGGLVPADAPIRAAVLHILTAQALRVAAGELGDLLWGRDDDPRVFVRALLDQGRTR